jgi:hypothetical protein
MECEPVAQRPGNKPYHFRGTKERVEVNLYRSAGLHGLQVDSCTFIFTLLTEIKFSWKWIRQYQIHSIFFSKDTNTRGCIYKHEFIQYALILRPVYKEKTKHTPWTTEHNICVTIYWGNLWTPTGEQFYIVCNGLHFRNKLGILAQTADCTCVCR